MNRVETANALSNANAALIDVINVVRGHDAVHPNRDECGGVGGCALMRAEHDAERSFIDALSNLARSGARISLFEE